MDDHGKRLGRYTYFWSTWKNIDKIPLNHEGTLSGLENGNPALCRCIFLDPKGFSPITADILIIPEEIKEKDNAMPIGPDAEL